MNFRHLILCVFNTVIYYIIILKCNTLIISICNIGFIRQTIHKIILLNRNVDISLPTWFSSALHLIHDIFCCTATNRKFGKLIHEVSNFVIRFYLAILVFLCNITKERERKWLSFLYSFPRHHRIKKYHFT